MSLPIPSISGSNGNIGANYVDRAPSKKLGQDDFIKLLVTQMTTQDPLNPQKDTEFIGQMAQFSALEGNKSMQSELQTLRANQMLGQTVQIKLDEDTNILGQVTAVDSTSGQPKLIVGDNSYFLKDVVRVEQASNNKTTL